MKRAIPVLALALVTSAPTLAQERPRTAALTCSAVKAIVAREHDVVLSSSAYVYEMIHSDNAACGSDDTGAPAFMPAADDASCMVGWRCVQRNNSGR